MQLETQKYLDMIEKAGGLAFFDIESNGFNADYGTAHVISIKPYKGTPISFAVKQIGNDRRVVREAKEALESFDCWVSFYGKGFDVPFLNTRLLRWGNYPLEARHHIDMYFTLKHHTKMSRKGLGAFSRFLNLAESKFDVSPDVWAELATNPKNLDTLVERCESDCSVLEQLYDKTRHVIRDIKRV